MGMSRSRNLASITLALLLGATACIADDPEASGTTLPTRDLNSEDIILTAGLETVADCEALLERLIADGLERVGPYGFNQGGYWWGGPEMIMAGTDDAAFNEGGDGGGDRDFAPTTTAPADAPAVKVAMGYPAPTPRRSGSTKPTS